MKQLKKAFYIDTYEKNVAVKERKRKRHLNNSLYTATRPTTHASVSFIIPLMKAGFTYEEASAFIKV